VPAEPDDLLAQQLRALRREYLADSTQRVDELRRLFARLSSGERAVLPELRQAFHRLAGSGGSYGFPVVSTQSREGERLVSRLVATDAAIAPADLESLRACVDGVAHAFAEALSVLNAESLG
jgi:chemotaxis protein histidine kinase CheA